MLKLYVKIILSIALGAIISSCDRVNFLPTTSLNKAIANDSINISEKYYNQGIMLFEMGKLDSAKVYYQRAIDSCKSNDAKTQFNYYMKLMGVYVVKNEYGDALAILRQFEQKKLHPKNEQVLLTLSTEQSVLTLSNQYVDALNTNIKLFEYAKEIDDKDQINRSLLSRISILQKLGRRGESDSLLNKMTQKADLNQFQMSTLYTLKGVSEFYNQNFEAAIDNYKRSLKLDKTIVQDSRDNLIAMNYANIAEVFIEMKEYNQAVRYLDSFKRIDQSKVSNDLRKSVFKYELRLARALNLDNKRLEEFVDKNYTEQEQFYKTRYDKELEALIIEKNKTEQLFIEKQTVAIEKVKLRNNAALIVGILLFVLLTAFFFIYNQRKNHMIDSLIKQQRLLRAQMNPHFIFNVLSSIQNLMRTDIVSASSFVTKFSRLLRVVLENSMRDNVSIIDELEVVRNYLDLQILRFPNLFCYEIKIDDVCNDEMLNIPPMLIQPFVENAIEHGFKGIKYEGKIIISISPTETGQESMIHCSISDNGKGYNFKTSQHKNSASVALISNFIRKSTGRELQIQRLNNHKPFGTLVSFNIITT